MIVRIPGEVRDYDRSIVFGLKPKQIIYAIGTFFLIALVYFQLNFLPDNARYAAMLSLALAGVGFMFFNFEGLIGGQLSFINSPKNVGFLDRKALEFIGAMEITGGVMHMKNGDLKAAVRVSPVNFSVADEEQKKAIFESYKNFINSLSGSSFLDMVPIQILVKTHELALDEFFENAVESSKATGNGEIVKLAESFRDFFKKKLREEKPNYRTFDIIVSVNKNETPGSKGEKEREELLAQRVETVMKGLRNAGLGAERLEDDGLVALYSSFFSPLCDLTSSYMKPITLHEGWERDARGAEPPKGTKGRFSMPMLDFVLAPSYINTKRDHIQVNDKYYRTLVVTGYPDTVSFGFIGPLISSSGTFHVSMHIRPTDFGSVLDYYNKLYERQAIDIATAQASGKIVPYSEIIKHEATAKLIGVLTDGSERAFMLSMYVLLEAGSLEKLDLLTDVVVAKVNECRLKPSKAGGKMDLGFRAALPLAKDPIGVFRSMTTSSVAACFPFTRALFEPDENGILFGISTQDGMPIICDPFSKSFENANGLVLGTSGSGKSFGVKTIAKRALQQGVDVIILDSSNEGEYGALTKAVGGEVIDFSPKSDASINPFQIYGQSYEEKIFFLRHLMRFLVPDIGEAAKDMLEDAFEAVYKKAGIDARPETWGREAPTLVDLYNYLNLRARDADFGEAATASQLALALKRFTKGPYSFINRQTSVGSLDNRLVTFNIGSLPKEIRRIVMFVTLELVYSRVLKDLKRKLLVVDEAWKLLQNEDEEGYLLTIVKTCRHHNLGLVLITQDVYDLLTSKAGRAVMANTAWQLLLRMKPAIIDEVGTAFKLNGGAKEFLLAAGPGNGLLFVNNTIIPLENVVDGEEYKIFTTHPQDVGAR